MPLTRRGLLGVLAAGSAGGLTGRGAVALLTDREATTAAVTTGVVDIVVEHWQDIDDGMPDLTDPDGVGDGTTLAVELDAVPGGPATRDLFRISLPQDRGGVNNPARVWLGGDCPLQTTLAELLTVRLSYSDADGDRGEPIVSGSLRQVASDLRDGVPLDEGTATGADGCLSDELFVLAEYELPTYVGDETASLPLTVVAVQCRNTPRTLTPFGTAAVDPCPPGYSCDCCWPIGTIEVEDGSPLRAGETYSFDEGLADYEIAVTAVDRGGVAFELVASDAPALPLCQVDIKGGPEYAHYTRTDGAFGFDTTVIDGATDGLVYTPVNGTNGTNYDISNIVVRVCAPELPEGGCPDPLTKLAKSGGGGR